MYVYPQMAMLEPITGMTDFEVMIRIGEIGVEAKATRAGRI